MILYEDNRSNLSEYIYNQNDENLNFGAHLHNSFEFIYVFNGEIQLTIDESSRTLKRGNSAIILPNQIHSYKTADYSKSYLCVFSNSYIYDFYEKTKDKFATNPVFSFNDLKIIEQLQSQSTSNYLLKSYLYYIIDVFNRGTSYETRNVKLFSYVSKILSFIENNYNQKISVKDVASQIGYDYHYLTNLIKKVLHTTFGELLNGYRIQHAQHLLNSTSKKITSIASDCGYESLCSFNRNFKQITNKTPKEFRK